MSRLFTRAAQTLTRIAVPQLSRSPLAYRTFATSLACRSTRSDLLEVLRAECKLASSIANDLSPKEEEYLSENGFKINYKENESNVELVKTMSTGEEMRVFFDIDEVTDVTFPPPEFNPEDGTTQKLDDEAFLYESTFANVKVLVSNPQKNNGLFFNMLLQGADEEFFVDYFIYKPDVKQFLEQVENEGEFLSKFEYQGPRFSNLDEALQTTVEKYLSDIGVDLLMAQFVFAFSEVKEESSYRELLNNVATYLEQ